ncbi:hypothetical protein [Parasitella parasitica]|uniref:Uncharacterized protein n=1 Tax=Parasitella parasitica TaxID=35722 RepID=A0A0B7N2W0_9FUNG|nr:hypothetical protein [Parasitella parasitica]
MAPSHRQTLGAKHHPAWISYFVPHRPSSTPVSISPPHVKVSHQDSRGLEAEILVLLKKRAIEETSGLGFRSHLFTVPKKNGDLRPVLNLKPLNEFIQRQHFHIETTDQVCSLVERNDYMAGIDFLDAFLHYLIHCSSRKFLHVVSKYVLPV